VLTHRGGTRNRSITWGHNMPWKEVLPYLSAIGPLAFLKEHGGPLQLLGFTAAGTAAAVIWVYAQFASQGEVEEIERRVHPDNLAEQYVARSEFEDLRKDWQRTTEAILDEVSGLRFELLRSERRRISREIYELQRLAGDDGALRQSVRLRLDNLKDDLKLINQAIERRQREYNGLVPWLDS
jgi:hypothetical protein